MYCWKLSVILIAPGGHVQSVNAHGYIKNSVINGSWNSNSCFAFNFSSFNFFYKFFIINEAIILTHNFNNDSDEIWLSSDEEIAIVENGMVIGVSEGEVIITLLIDNNEATKVINVVYPVINITIESQSTLKIDESYDFKAIIPSQFEDLDEGKWYSLKTNSRLHRWAILAVFSKASSQLGNSCRNSSSLLR